MASAVPPSEDESHESRTAATLHGSPDRCCAAGSGAAWQSCGGQPQGAGLGAIRGMADNGQPVDGGPVAHAGGAGDDTGGNQS